MPGKIKASMIPSAWDISIFIQPPCDHSVVSMRVTCALQEEGRCRSWPLIALMKAPKNQNCSYGEQN